MALSVRDEDARDLGLRGEVQEASEAFEHASGEERSIAQGHYLELLKAFATPPAFDRLNQSPEDWVRAVNAAWRQHRDRFQRACGFWVEADVVEEIPV